MVLEHISVEDQRDAQRNDGERYPVQPQGRQADDDPQRKRSRHAHRDGHYVVDVKRGGDHPRGVRTDAGKRGLAEGDLSDIAGEQDEAQQAEGPDHREPRVEFEADVETYGDPRQHREGDQGHEHADHQARGHFAATANPRGLRTTSTARITSNATSRGNPID